MVEGRIAHVGQAQPSFVGATHEQQSHSKMIVDPLVGWLESQACLQVLQTHGHIDCNDGMYSITRSGQVTLDGYAPVSRWTGEVYKPKAWNIREGAENHKQYQSRGF